ncbi:hypothetical protein LBMAG16_08320 [Actinomycetes bacterium]|nr:hypothetical protein LBMAG16_08320 [Actinomycetes bacterium]
MSSSHAAIEQVNRLFTGVVAASVILAVMLSLRLRPKRRDLIGMSFGLVVGVLTQVILGGLVVLTGLNPFFNIAHFLVSIFLITNAYLLLQHAKIVRTSEIVLPRQDPELTNRKVIVLVRSVLIMIGVAIATGTVVTGSGPHAGDENAKRIDIAINLVVKIHSSSVLLSIFLSVILLILARRDRKSWLVLASSLQRFIFVAVFQGLLGYVQYFAGIPVYLVAVHVATSVVVWLSALSLYWQSRLPRQASSVLD